jgi:hypothetical protein
MKKMKIIFGVLIPFSIFSFIGCTQEDSTDSCIQGQKRLGLCTAQFDPVCGCNKKTYGNSCEAENDGITEFTKGACK